MALISTGPESRDWASWVALQAGLPQQAQSLLTPATGP
jgi:hypothetical protein